MRILNNDDIYSLSKRGYLKYSTYNGNLSKIPEVTTGRLKICLDKLKDYDIIPKPYVDLLIGIGPACVKQMIRFINLQWYSVATSLKDVYFDKDVDLINVCEFFMDDKDKSHRVYFFVEILYQYFFP